MYLLKKWFVLIQSNPIFCLGIFYLHTLQTTSAQGDPGDPLILTPLIEQGKISEAQEACKVKPLKSNITSYAGFFTVDKTTNSNMFFWFFPAYENCETAPVLLWLQGGPGASSLFGLFNENGPFSIQSNYKLKLREFPWTKFQSVIYIDNPVGTGFSFTNGGYSTNEIQIGLNLYIALTQFFKLFPQFQKNDFFVTGESYAGKYIPAVSYTIHRKNPSAKLKINLKGLAIGDGLCDPVNMLNYGDYLYQISLLDSHGRDLFKKEQDKIVQLIKQKKWSEAFLGFDYLLNGDFTNNTLFENLTGFTNYDNFLYVNDVNTGDNIESFLSNLETRKNLHVGNLPFQIENLEIEKILNEDVMKSVSPWIEILLENYRVLFYNGQLDIIVAYPLTESFIKTLKWSGATEYKTAPRKMWYVEEELAGYVKTAKSLTLLVVRNAGHTVPTDQPKWALDMITRFTRNKLF